MTDHRLAWGLIAVIARYLTTIQPHARPELARWKRRAHAIPDPQLRCRVLRTFDADRSVEGAAIFAGLNPTASHELVPLLVAYVLVWSCVDAISEQEPECDARVFEALVDALNPERPARAYGCADDRGYLAELVGTCKEGCARLPSWDVAGPPARLVARYGGEVQAINHGPREAVAQRLRTWAQRHEVAPAVPWQDVCAGASGPLAILALMALSAAPDASPAQATATVAAYYPSFCALSVLIDHVVDQASDATEASHSFLTYYEDTKDVASSMHRLAQSAARAARTLDRGERHVVILATMAAMILAADPDRGPDHRAVRRAVLNGVGQPASLLYAITRLGRRS